MNTSITYDDLPKAEREVADFYAWGMTKKEIALIRGKSIFTIDNQVRRLFEKTGTRKDTEFASWYFCSRFKISFDLSPVKRAIVSICLLTLLTIGTILDAYSFYRVRSVRVRSTRTEQMRRARRIRRFDEYDADGEYQFES